MRAWQNTISEPLLSWSWQRIVASSFCTWVVYLILLGIHRLYFHPLSKFPGPRLAAATQWYETFYDVFRKGQFTFEIQRMHQKYGPIVRINPEELHIDDPDYYDVIYATGKLYDKMEFFSARLNMPLSTFATAESSMHKTRRAAIAPFFSKQRVRAYEHLIQDIVNRMSHRLSTEYIGTGKMLNLSQMWGAMTSDVITDVVFARPMGFSNSPDFYSQFTTAIKDILAGRNKEARLSSRKTVFHDILSSNLPTWELTAGRLQNEAMSVVAAGVETTSWALSVGCYHILANEAIEQRLRYELEHAIPDQTRMIPVTDLEKLPYLAAVIQESLRMSYGLVQRLPRINPRSPWQFGQYSIPPGTPVSMDAYHMHNNENIFPNCQTFKPERWLNNPTGPDGTTPLGHYMVAFSGGTRMCIGINLAYAEIYIGLATMFRRHRFKLHETDKTDIEFAIDMITPQPKLTSNGVRVLVELPYGMART
ncbi:unnamed protein product [Clonostachys rosea]|uniref:Cytochrome P450 n=1 Tax=Bionectria ochroleuca TaxID=29856 RepID=A0ABY6UA33_BIOOC|nr:unnamed protein product [Clonostachys rosea]